MRTTNHLDIQNFARYDFVGKTLAKVHHVRSAEIKVPLSADALGVGQYKDTTIISIPLFWYVSWR
jgi:hypothetical protein